MVHSFYFFMLQKWLNHCVPNWAAFIWKWIWKWIARDVAPPAYFVTLAPKSSANDGDATKGRLSILVKYHKSWNAMNRACGSKYFWVQEEEAFDLSRREVCPLSIGDMGSGNPIVVEPKQLPFPYFKSYFRTPPLRDLLPPTSLRLKRN